MSALKPLLWRWEHITQGALLAAPYYLFPVYAFKEVTWTGILLFLTVVCGYGNMKYLLLILPFLFSEETHR